MIKQKLFFTALGLSVLASLIAANGFSAGIVHDAEYNKLLEQHGEKWAAEDSLLDKKLAALKAKYGKSPNIIHLMWDDSGYGDVGSPLLTRIHGVDTPNIAKMADEGISFTRMYTEPSCTPTRAATLTGRHPIRSGMYQVIFPIHGIGLPGEEVTIAEILSQAGYSTAFFGKAHQGDIEESYLHNQGFDEALFTPMNQITSLYSAQGTAVNAVIGFNPEIYPRDPYQLDRPGLLPSGWVQIIEGKKGEPGYEWRGTDKEDYDAFDPETKVRPSALNATAVTISVCPSKRRRSRPVVTSHRRTVSEVDSVTASHETRGTKWYGEASFR